MVKPRTSMSVYVIKGFIFFPEVLQNFNQHDMFKHIGKIASMK
jgi:hypothetical protein